jgi:hypothetical protein
MNKHILRRLTIVFLVLYSSYTYSQKNVRKNVIPTTELTKNQNQLSDSTASTNSSKSVVKEPVRYPLTISKKMGEEQVVHDEEYLKKEISRINNHIKAIDFKVENVSSDETKKAKAESDGWFDQMKNTKVSLEQKRIKLEEELKIFKN